MNPMDPRWKTAAATTKTVEVEATIRVLYPVQVTLDEEGRVVGYLSPTVDEIRAKVGRREARILSGLQDPSTGHQFNVKNLPSK